MTFLEELFIKRQNLASVLTDPDCGIRNIVEDLYPDRVHFIYELLQNAEDKGATEACFILEKEMLVFEHNGRAFSEVDVRGITNIGNSNNQVERIGRFGAGFKAVFAYCEHMCTRLPS